MIKLTCQVCGKEYFRIPSAAKNSKHCSKKCHNIIAGRIGGKIGGKIGGLKTKGRKRPDLAEYNHTHIRRGIESPVWKGNEVGYTALHNWAHNYVGLKNRCNFCGSRKNLEMSNKSQKYKRDVDDWQTLCRKCHRTFDAAFRRNGGVSRKLYRWKKQNPQ